MSPRVHLLSDPHFGRDMGRFGEVWANHEDRLEAQWLEVVDPDDIVLIPGDLSWATTTKAIQQHLERLDGWPGQKIISPGNHCKFWKKTPRLQYDSIEWIDDDHRPFVEGYTLAATMGWDCPESTWWKDAMQTDFELACGRLSMTLDAATASGAERILLMIHYPPRWKVEETPTAFEEIIARHPVDLVVYGHIHGVDLPLAHDGLMKVGDREITYVNGSADRLKMRPLTLNLEAAGRPDAV